MEASTRSEETENEPNPSKPSVVSHSVNAFALPQGQQTADVALVDELSSRAATSDYDQMFVEHYDRLVRTLTVVAGDRESAADAVQDAFVKAHLKWRTIGKYDDPAGWVRRVAINKLRDEHRRNARKHRAIGRLRSRADETADAPEIDEFDRLLRELPLQQRTATALFYVHGLTVDDIARTMQLSAGSVKSHLHDARKRLRPLLERENRNDAEGVQ